MSLLEQLNEQPDSKPVHRICIRTAIPQIYCTSPSSKSLPSCLPSIHSSTPISTYTSYQRQTLHISSKPDQPFHRQSVAPTPVFHAEFAFVARLMGCESVGLGARGNEMRMGVARAARAFVAERVVVQEVGQRRGCVERRTQERDERGRRSFLVVFSRWTHHDGKKHVGIHGQSR